MARRRNGYSKEWDSFVTLDGAMRAFVLTAICLVTFNGIRLGSHLGIFDPLFIGGGVLWVVGILVKSDRPLVIPRSALAAAGICLSFGLVSSMLSDTPAESIVGLARLLIAAVGVPLLVGATCRTESIHDLARKSWVLFAALNGFVGFLELSWGHGIAGALTDSRHFIGRTVGLTTQPNHLGLVCAMATPVAIAWLLDSGVTKQRIVAIASLLALQVGILASGSRAVLAGVCVSVFILAVLERRARKPVLWLGIIGVLVLVGLAFIDHRIFEMVTYGFRRLTGDMASVKVSDDVRVVYYADAFRLFADAPMLGVGFQHVRHYHDIYLQVLQAGGIIGFLAFFSYLGRYVYLGFVLTRSIFLTEQQRLVASALTASIGTWLFVEVTHNEIYDRYIYIPFGLLLGLMALSRSGSPVRYERAASQIVQDEANV